MENVPETKVLRVGFDTLRGFVEREFFAPDFIAGYRLTDILRDGAGDWVLVLDRDRFAPFAPFAPEQGREPEEDGG